MLTKSQLHDRLEKYPDPMTAEEAAIELRVTAKCVREKCVRGDINAFAFGKVWRIPKRYLVDYLSESGMRKEAEVA